MKKQERMKAAKAYAFALSKGQTPDKETGKTLKEEGCSLFPGKRGEYVFRDKDGKEYVFWVSKKTVTTYSKKEYDDFRQFDHSIATADSQAKLRIIQDGLDHTEMAKSLKNSLQEGIDRIFDTLPDKAPKAERKKIERLPKEQQQEAVFNLMMELDGKLEFTQKKAGSCVWVKGDFKPFKDALKRAGFVWSPKRQAYYWKPVAIVAA